MLADGSHGLRREKNLLHEQIHDDECKARLLPADVLVDAELQRRTTARADKDWATADAVRDRLIAAGIDVTDTPDGPQWSLKKD